MDSKQTSFKFDCNILRNNYMSSSGFKLKSMIQNNSTPLMDLFVRESLQNSLDAVLPETNGQVYVNYTHGHFDIPSLSSFYDILGPRIYDRRGSLSDEFVSISDSNTTGLIGRDNGSATSYEDGQNLANLVFNIQNAQTNEGSGGSWGLGKLFSIV